MPSQRCGIKDRELPAVENHILTTEKNKTTEHKKPS